ncbi:MAG TPA: DUF4194 domain-containing protein [Verrucomicrobiae bacterium]
MSVPQPTFAPAAFVKARLLREPIYREDGELWLTVRGQQDEIRHYFRQIGQELVVDEAEGYAFIRQLELEGEDRVPRLVQRHSLSYLATLLAVCLRDEFLRFDAAPGDSTRLVLSREDLRNFILDFLRETTNEVRDIARLDRAIQQLVELGFLRPLSGGEENRFEAMRIVKARIRPTELEDIKQRLLRHAQSGT